MEYPAHGGKKNYRVTDRSTHCDSAKYRKAIDFISKHRENPFFIYLPHTMPHVPLYVPDDVYDPDPKNAYTYVIEHIDAETGRMLDMLRETGLDKNTYVIFTSDNGPWTYLKKHAGSSGPIRGLKGETWEGGMCVPCVVWAPGRIPADTECDQLATTLDLLPTIAALTGSHLPENIKVDGIDISGLLAEPAEKSPRKEFLYYLKKGGGRDHGRICTDSVQGLALSLGHQGQAAPH